MKIDTKEMEHDFTTMEVDGLTLVSPREIGIEVARQHLDDDEIWQSDLIYDIQQYFADLIDAAFNASVETLRENNRDIYCMSINDDYILCNNCKECEKNNILWR